MLMETPGIRMDETPRLSYIDWPQALGDDEAVKISLLGVNGALNSGDQELCSGTIRLVREVFPETWLRGIHRNPELQARHFPEVEWFRQIGVSYSANRFIKRLANLGGMAAAAGLAAVRMRSGLGLPPEARVAYRAVAGADLVVACAGGWLEDHYVSIWTNLVHLAIATAHGVPIFFAPQSIGPFNRAAARQLAKWVFRRACGITVREEISLDYLRGMGFAGDGVRLFPDLALFAQDADHAGAGELFVRLCGSDPPALTGTTLMPWSFPGSADPAAEMARYLDKVEATTRLLHQRTGMKTLFLRQIREDRGYQGDGALLQQMAARTRDCAIVCPDYLEPPLLRGMIARCRAFWGSRMHSNIFAASQRVPVVTVAYQHKAEGIMRMLGLGDYVVWIDSFEPAQLVGLIEDALARREPLAAHLDARFLELQDQWGVLREFLRECVSQTPVGRAALDPAAHTGPLGT